MTIRLCLILVALAVPRVTAAQTTLHLMLGACQSGACASFQIVHFDLDRGAMTGSTRLTCRPAGNLVTAGGGRYLLWADVCSTLNLLDLTDGQRLSLPWPHGTTLRAHPTALRIFASNESGLVTVTPAGTAVDDLPCRFGGLRALSGDGQSRVHQCWRGPIMQLSFDVLVERRPASDTLIFEAPSVGLALNVDGSALFAVSQGSAAPSPTADVRRFDVSAGVETVKVTYPAATAGSALPFVDPRTARLFVVRPGELLAFDPDSLAQVGAAPIAGSPVAMVFHPTAPVAYVASVDGHKSVISIIDTTTAAVMLSVVSPFTDPVMDLALVSHPPAPVNVTHAVVGRQVSLGWSLPVTGPGATEYVLEAGSGSGLANLARFRTPTPSLVVDGVPPGVYYVRVRARNYAGESSPSNEMVVTVP